MAKRANVLSAKQVVALFRDRQVMDLRDAATYVGLTARGLDNAAYMGKIGYIDLGNRKLFTRADLDEYLALRGRGQESQLPSYRAGNARQPSVVERLTAEEAAQLRPVG